MTMRLLPCLRFESARWWLPRSDRSTELLTAILLRCGCPLAEDFSFVAQTVAHCLQDPPFLIYAGLSYRESTGASADVSISELAQWFCTNATGLFTPGDAFLGAPLPNPSGTNSSLSDRWSELYSYFRTLPCDQWLKESALWLEATGPPVPPSWRERWPELIFDSETIDQSSIESSSDGLQQLACKLQHLQEIEHSFDRRLHESKLAALQQLAYGLSHEINNPLANISTRAQQLQRQQTDPSAQQSLERIVEQVYRAHEMIADLMFYANPPQPQIASCDLTQLVLDVTSEFRDEADRLAVRLETDASPELTAVMVDREMVGEAVRILIRNAMEAIGSEGTIVVSLARESDGILMRVADSGPGLTRRAREHAFDPYYSGREAGRGLGLGLCRAYRIAKLHHAEITLAGGPIGCVATIRLP